MVIAAYWRWAQRYYQPNESGTLRVVLRMLRQYHGSEAAEDFGPKKLRALREAMIAGDDTCDPRARDGRGGTSTSRCSGCGGCFVGPRRRR
jgi:hypothetical protein